MDAMQLERLDSLIAQITVLEKNEDRTAFNKWRKHVELLLKQLLGNDADEVAEFKRLDGHTSVITPDKNQNAEWNTEAYSRDLKAAHSLLSAISEYLKANLASDLLTHSSKVPLGV